MRVQIGEFYKVTSNGRFGGRVGRYERNDYGVTGVMFPGQCDLVYIPPQSLRPATNAELGKFVREADLEVVLS